MPASTRGHRTRSHTADVILEAWGPDLASCGEEAVAALVSTFVSAAPVDEVMRRRVHLAPADDPSLLVDLLEEIIFTLDTSDDVPVRAHVEPADDGGLDVVIAMARRDAVEATGAVPKAVARSGLEVRTAPARVTCRVLVDV